LETGAPSVKVTTAYASVFTFALKLKVAGVNIVGLST